MFFYYFKIFLTKSLLLLIRLYQKTLSLDHGLLKLLRPRGQCKFYPTCSDYTYQAIKEYGIFKGSQLSLKRIIRCHPWSMGGYDPIGQRASTPTCVGAVSDFAQQSVYGFRLYCVSADRQGWRDFRLN